MARRNDIDWSAVERDYRVGQLTVRQIAKHHGIAASSIVRKAEKEGWTRDLTEEVRSKTKAALLLNATPHATQRNTPTRDDVDVAVSTNVELVRQHRTSLGRANRIVAKLLDELESGTDDRAEIEETIGAETEDDQSARRRDAMLKAVSLPSRAAVARELSQTLKNLIPLERQAFNLDDGAGGEDGEPKAIELRIVHPVR